MREPVTVRVQRSPWVGRLGLLLPLVFACATAPQPPPRTAQGETGGYPGRCSLLTLEVMSQPGTAPGVSPDELGFTSTQLVARYRPGDRHGTFGPLSFLFVVRRESVEDLQAHLQQYPEVVCHPPEAGEADGYVLEVPRFEDDQGNPVSPVQIGEDEAPER
jgi:hypothetical protein